MAKDLNIWNGSGKVERVTAFDDAVLVTVAVADDKQEDGKWINRSHYITVSYRGITADWLKKNNLEGQWVVVSARVAMVKKGDVYNTYFNGISIATQPAYMNSDSGSSKSSSKGSAPRSKYKRNASPSIEEDYDSEEYDDDESYFD